MTILALLVQTLVPVIRHSSPSRTADGPRRRRGRTRRRVRTASGRSSRRRRPCRAGSGRTARRCRAGTASARAASGRSPTAGRARRRRAARRARAWRRTSAGPCRPTAPATSGTPTRSRTSAGTTRRRSASGSHESLVPRPSVGDDLLLVHLDPPGPAAVARRRTGVISRLNGQSRLFVMGDQASAAASRRGRPQLSRRAGQLDRRRTPADWRYLVDRASAAEEAGIDRVVVSDHVVFGEDLEAYGRPSSAASPAAASRPGPTATGSSR